MPTPGEPGAAERAEAAATRRAEARTPKEITQSLGDVRTTLMRIWGLDENRSKVSDMIQPADLDAIVKILTKSKIAKPKTHWRWKDKHKEEEANELALGIVKCINLTGKTKVDSAFHQLLIKLGYDLILLRTVWNEGQALAKATDKKGFKFSTVHEKNEKRTFKEIHDQVAKIVETLGDISPIRRYRRLRGRPGSAARLALPRLHHRLVQSRQAL